MHILRASLLIVLIAVALPLLQAAEPKSSDPAPQADRSQIEKLIKQLGDDSFAARQKAAKELEAIGEPALDLLRHAAGDADREVSKQATELVERIWRDGRHGSR